jgi:cold shock CspA family protein
MIVIVTEIKTKTEGYVFGISNEHEGEDILIHQNAFRGTHNAFSKLKPGDQVKGEIETNKDGKFRLQRYKKITD